ncbi:hypothetical protein H6F96_21805 [Microcoleus sp. FACHB-53]|nr:hypothetical protein [Microcoleus sp. FACHB-53]
MNTVTIPLNLPSVPLLERHNLPRCQSIYFVLESGVIPLHPDALSVEEKALLGKH